jgi:hypothetical protein
MKKLVSLTLCLLFSLSFSIIALETSDTQQKKTQDIVQPSPEKMQDDLGSTTPMDKKISNCPLNETENMAPEQKQEMLKKCDKMESMTPEQKQAVKIPYTLEKVPPSQDSTIPTTEDILKHSDSKPLN